MSSLLYVAMAENSGTPLIACLETDKILSDPQIIGSYNLCTMQSADVAVIHKVLDCS
jgi:hypothetical protein